MFANLVTLALALSVVANPMVVIRDSPINIPLMKRYHTVGDNRTLIMRDREHITSLYKHRHGGLRATDITTSAYVVNVTVGNPPTEYTLLLDTGSSNTWVGADLKKPFKPSSTTVQPARMFGEFSGTEVIDRLDLGNGLVVEKQGIGAASSSSGLRAGFDGILGVGPVDLTIGSLSPNTTTPIPTVTDNLFAQGTIPENLVAVSFEPSTSISDTNGVVTFGSVDSSRFTGDIHFTSRTQVQNSSLWWGIDQTLTYGQSTPILSQSTAGIVDTGTTLLLLNTDAFVTYQTATGAVLDDRTGLLQFTPEQYAALESLFFHINGVTFEFTANAQIFPRKFNALVGGDPDGIYGIVGDLGTPPPLVPVFNSAFVNGMAFLERFYSVYDTTNNRIGLATTKFTYADIN